MAEEIVFMNLQEGHALLKDGSKVNLRDLVETNFLSILKNNSVDGPTIAEAVGGADYYRVFRPSNTFKIESYEKVEGYNMPFYGEEDEYEHTIIKIKPIFI